MTSSDLSILFQGLECLKHPLRRNYLQQHLRAIPEFEGQPTHRRIGRRIVFYPEDIQCLLASLEKRPNRDLKHSGGIPEPSAERAYAAAVTLLKKKRAELAAQKKARRRR